MKIHLLAVADLANPLTDTSFGGRPVKEANVDATWPRCRNCGAEMQYLGKLQTTLGLELLFMCNQRPGGCRQWEADGGGNTVVVIPTPHNPVFYGPENPGLSLRKTEYGCRVVEVEREDYDQARESWTGASRREVLGKRGGQPEWLQNEERPVCDCCRKPMHFVAQLEEGPAYETAMNFGGGVGYLFDCEAGKTAKFLWQC